MSLAFSNQEYQRRFKAVCDEAARRRIDYLLLTEPAHICWISGFDPSGLFYKNQLHIDVKTGESAILTHFAEAKLARIGSWVEDILVWSHGDNPMEMAVNHGKKYWHQNNRRLIGMNLNTPYLSVADYYALRGGFGDMGVVDVTGLIDDVRMKKSKPELDALRTAAEYAAEALAAAYEAIAPGVREIDVNAVIQETLVSVGCEYPAFPTLVSSGPRTGLFHAFPSKRVIEEGDPVVVEIMGVYKRYHASIIRTVFAGKANAEARKIYGIVRSAYESGLSAIAPGNPVGQIDRNTRKARRDYSDYIPARSGFGVELGYPPSPIGNLSILDGDPHTLEPGYAFTLEPSIAGYNDWTIIIGNCVVINETGYELLFDENVDLLELG